MREFWSADEEDFGALLGNYDDDVRNKYTLNLMQNWLRHS